MENAYIKRFICFKNFNEFLCIHLGEERGGGVTNACNIRVYMGTHSQPFLQNRLMDIYETWLGWSAHGPLQVLLFFGQIRPGVDPGRGQNRSLGVPFLNELLLQTGRLQQQTECITMI